MVSILVPLALLTAGASGLHGVLPTLSKEPWFGFFVGHMGSRGQLGIAADGSLVYNHNEDQPNVIGGHPHRIYPSVEETLPDGRVIIKQVLPETLETSDEATEKPGKVRYRGQVKGGASVEVEVEFSRRDIRIRGRLVNDGGIKNPLRFTFFTRTPPFYRLYDEKQRLANADQEEKLKLERQNERLKGHASKEEIVLKRLDGGRVKQPLLEPATFTDEFNGKGFSEIYLDFNWLNGRRITFNADNGSRMLLRNPGDLPIFKKGFNFLCMADPAKGADGIAELTITTR